MSSGSQDTVCQPCEFNFSKTKLGDIEGSFVAIPWLQHLFYIDGLRRVGATFSINELTREEWDGLLLIEGVRADVERERTRKAEEKAKVQAALQKGRSRRG